MRTKDEIQQTANALELTVKNNACPTPVHELVMKMQRDVLYWVLEAPEGEAFGKAITRLVDGLKRDGIFDLNDITKPPKGYTKSVCPYCGHLMEGIRHPDARMKDFALCDSCAGILVFGEDMILKKPDENAYRYMIESEALRFAIIEHRQEILNRKR